MSRQCLDVTASIPQESHPRERMKSIRLSYLDRLSSVLGRTFRPPGLRPAFRNSKVIRKFMVNLKDGLPRHKKRGIYRLQRNHCPDIYIGKTDESLPIMIGEEVNARVLKTRGISAYADHLIDQNYTLRRVSEVLRHRRIVCLLSHKLRRLLFSHIIASAILYD